MRKRDVCLFLNCDVAHIYIIYLYINHLVDVFIYAISTSQNNLRMIFISIYKYIRIDVIIYSYNNVYCYYFNLIHLLVYMWMHMWHMTNYVDMSVYQICVWNSCFEFYQTISLLSEVNISPCASSAPKWVDIYNENKECFLSLLLSLLIIS